MGNDVNVYTLLKKRDIQEFYDMVGQWCKLHDIKPNLRNFLNHDKNDYGVGENFKFLYRAPKEMLFSSQSFIDFYQQLPTDFQADISVDKRELKLKMDRHPEIKSLLRVLMDNDYRDI